MATKCIIDLLSTDEKSVVKEVIEALGEAGVDDDMIGFREVVITTMISKQRVDVAVKKYQAMLAVFETYEFTLKDLYDPKVFNRVEKHFGNYHVCGKDKDGLEIMWIDGQPTPVAEEQISVMAGIMYWMAVHSDIFTLRNGILFVIDTSNKDTRIGNERKLQATWQSMALRPQHIFITGAGYLKRFFINGLIKFASLFTKSKVIQRIEFVDMPHVEKFVPEKSRPDYSMSRSERVMNGKRFVAQRLSLHPAQIGLKNCLSQLSLNVK